MDEAMLNKFGLKSVSSFSENTFLKMRHYKITSNQSKSLPHPSLSLLSHHFFFFMFNMFKHITGSSCKNMSKCFWFHISGICRKEIFYLMLFHFISSSVRNSLWLFLQHCHIFSPQIGTAFWSSRILQGDKYACR